MSERKNYINKQTNKQTNKVRNKAVYTMIPVMFCCAGAVRPRKKTFVNVIGGRTDGQTNQSNSSDL